MRFTAKVAASVFAVVSLYLAAALAIGPDAANANLCAVVDRLSVGAGAPCTTNLGIYAVRAAAIAAAISLCALLIDAVVWYTRRRARRKMTVIPAVTSAPTPIADMPIRDVFFHIDADVLEHGRANAIGQNLLDLLSTGQLKAYGRRAHFGNDVYVGFPNLSLIDTEYWKTADFTYYFFGENREQDVHAETRKPAQGPSYRDLRFDSDAVKQRWIKSKPTDQIFAMRAIHNVLSQSEWAYKLAISPDSMPALHYESGMTRKEVIKRRLIASLKYDLHAHLRAGDIDGWGKVDRHHPLSPIPKEEWDKVQLAMGEDYLGKLNSGFTTPISSKPGAAHRIIHESVMFRRSQMNAIYPLLKESFWK